MAACRLLTTLLYIYDLSKIEIFFIDWEKTEVKNPIKINAGPKPLNA